MCLQGVCPFLFLSTPSARRATPERQERKDREMDFYPRPPRGGRRWPLRGRNSASTHFYPRPPRGGRPRRCRSGSYGIPISIHALREEGDRRTTPRQCQHKYFYPRPPRGGRHWIVQLVFDFTKFLSTPSARRATKTAASSTNGNVFLSTPSARRATSCGLLSIFNQSHFYPRPPRGGRHFWLP